LRRGCRLLLGLWRRRLLHLLLFRLRLLGRGLLGLLLLLLLLRLARNEFLARNIDDAFQLIANIGGQFFIRRQPTGLPESLFELVDRQFTYGSLLRQQLVGLCESLIVDLGRSCGRGFGLGDLLLGLWRRRLLHLLLFRLRLLGRRLLGLLLLLLLGLAGHKLLAGSTDKGFEAFLNVIREALAAGELA